MLKTALNQEFTALLVIIFREFRVQVSVIDQGPGIPPTERKRVFKAFQRGQNVENGSVQGAGLGLAICKGLVEAHGGRIWIKKQTTPGTSIIFTIPLAPSNITDSVPENE